MDLYDRLAKDMGVTRDVAKVRAFAAAYATGDAVSEVQEHMNRYYQEAQMNTRDNLQLSDAQALNALGSEKTTYTYEGVNKVLLEAFLNPMAGLPGDAFGEIEIVAPEFTSLCPKTGQPDFAEIYVKYTPREKCVESKSFKLYLGSFRQTGEFHEACVARIASDLIELLDPRQLEVIGRFTPRGGIKFWPRVVYYGTTDDQIGHDVF